MRTRGRTVLYLNHLFGSVAAMHERNAVSDVLSGVLSDRGGAFEKVIVIMFPAGRRDNVQLASDRRLIEFDVPEIRWLDRIGLHPIAALLRELAFLVFTIAIIVRERVALIEATEPFINGPNALILSRLTRVPYSIHVTTPYELSNKLLGLVPAGAIYRTQWVSKAIERLVFTNADLLFADRRFYAEYGIANGAPKDRLILGRVIVDPVYYTEPSTRPSVRARFAPKGERIVLYVGRIAIEKHVIKLVHVLARLQQEHDVVLVMAGSGPLEEDCRALAVDLGVAEKLRITGALPLDTLPALMTSADVIVGPHMGFTLVEAALSGTAIVAYDWEWHGELIAHGRTGILVPFGDWGAMATEVTALLDDGERATRLGRAAREYALAHHDREAVRADYRAAFEQFFAKRERRRVAPRAS